MKKVAHHTIVGKIRLLTPMRISGSDDLLQIGGTDLSCIKDAVTALPYIPGSSLKGRMRSSLERAHGKYGGMEGRDPCGCDEVGCPVCRVFGAHNNRHGLGPTRILVRDAPLLEGGATETKAGTAIDRSTGAARGGSLRSEERVAAGSVFKLEIAIQEFDFDSDQQHPTIFRYRVGNDPQQVGGEALKEVVLHCLDLIQETGLGSRTSSGSGQIEIVDLGYGPKRPRLKLPPTEQKQPQAPPDAGAGG